MKEKGFSSLITILGIVLFVGVAGGMYYLGQTNIKLAPTPQSITGNTSSSPSLSQPVTNDQQPYPFLIGLRAMQD